MPLLSDVFSTITGSLPVIKISKWDVQLLNEPRKIEKSDNFLSSLINTAKYTVRLVQDTISGFFQNTDENYQTIAEFDSFISFQGSHNSQIVKNAIEQGSFRSVNKIKQPDTIIVELAKGGYRSGVEAVLSKLRKYEGSTRICRIVTPFGNLKNLNIVKLDYSYTQDSGANLLVARLTLQEIIGGSVDQAKYKLGTVSSPDKTNTSDTGQKAVEKKDWIDKLDDLSKEVLG